LNYGAVGCPDKYSPFKQTLLTKREGIDMPCGTKTETKKKQGQS